MYGSTPLRVQRRGARPVTRDREFALTALVARAIERERTQVSPSDALALERRVVGARFGGSAVAYRSALVDAGASIAVARATGDELRWQEIVERLSLARSRSADVSRFRATFAPVLARGDGLAGSELAPRVVVSHWQPRRRRPSFGCPRANVPRSALPKARSWWRRTTR